MPYPRALCIEATCLAVRPKRQNTQLPPGSRGGRYEGRRYSEKEAMEQKWDDQLTYRFGLSVGMIVDGAEGRNATRHTNHACEPNYQAVEHRGRGSRLEVRIETLRVVSAGEELTLDYALQVDPESQDDHACDCGSSQCRGTMLEPKMDIPAAWRYTPKRATAFHARPAAKRGGGDPLPSGAERRVNWRYCFQVASLPHACRPLLACRRAMWTMPATGFPTRR